MTSHGNLLFEINFNNISTLHDHWNIEVKPPRYVNNELQRYSEDMFKIENNELVIMTIKNHSDIKSGRINSKGKLEIQYGYIEALIKFTGGKGIWPAFWLLGNNGTWPSCGEIDIMEWVGWNPNACYATLHGVGYSGGNAVSVIMEVKRLLIWLIHIINMQLNGIQIVSNGL
jgi:beta-glucanase (GH16 family)